MNRLISYFKEYPLDAAVIAIVVYLGIIHLSYPFHGDQALFMVAAKKMTAGGVLYKDFWDIKQPGIFIFFYLAGSIFGFTEVGIHFFELIYWLVFSIFLIRISRNLQFFDNQKLCSLLPLFVVGPYYCNAVAQHLTQVEMIVNFPIMLLLWTLLYIEKNDTHRFLVLFLSGVICGVILLFKVIFLPIIGILYLIFFIRIYPKKSFKELIINYLVPIITGLFVFIIPIIIYYFKKDLLPSVYYNFFILPRKVVSLSTEINPTKLSNSILWFTKYTLIILIFSFLGWYTTLKYKTRSLYIYLIFLWLAALVVILMQRTSWWSYHFQLLYLPTGLLAAKGAAYGWEKIKPYFNISRSFAINFGLFMLIVFSVQCALLAKETIQFVKCRFALRAQDQEKYQTIIYPSNVDISQEIQFLKEKASIPGPIFICGDPRYYWLSGRDQSISMHGWSIQFFIPEEWNTLYNQLMESSSAYIYVNDHYFGLMKERYPKMIELLTQRYVLYKRTPLGYWYELASK